MATALLALVMVPAIGALRTQMAAIHQMRQEHRHTSLAESHLALILAQPPQTPTPEITTYRCDETTVTVEQHLLQTSGTNQLWQIKVTAAGSENTPRQLASRLRWQTAQETSHE